MSLVPVFPWAGVSAAKTEMAVKAQKINQANYMHVTNDMTTKTKKQQKKKESWSQTRGDRW